MPQLSTLHPPRHSVIIAADPDYSSSAMLLRRWSGVVSKPLDLHLWSKSLLEPALSLARKGVGDHPLGVSDVREMAQAYDNLILGRNELCKNTDRGSYEQD